MKHKLRGLVIALILTLLLLLHSLPLIIIQIPVQASPDIVTQNPSAESGQWAFPTFAYTSNDQRATTSVTGRSHEYSGYDFDSVLPEGITIDKVEIGAEHYETESPDVLYVRFTWDGGSTWSGYAKIQSLDTEILEWIDATGVTDWTRDKLLDANLRVEVKYVIAAGCYPNNTYLIVYDETGYSIKNPEEISIGETVLVWNEEKGIHHSDVIQVDAHYGNWTLMDFYSGNMTFQTPQGPIVWNKHLTVTSNHPMYDPIQDGERPANTFQVGDTFAHLNKGELIYLPVDKIDTWNATSNVYNVVVEEKNTCIFVKSFNETELEILSRFPMWRFVGNFDNIAMAIKEPFTTYLDWLPVRVTYSEEEEVEVDCDWIGVNNTIAGRPTLFSSDWTDLNQTDGLSHNLFSTNNTGIWTNDTWTDTWYSGNWTRTIKTLNSTLGLVIAFRFYVNDTGGDEYDSTICFFPTMLSVVAIFYFDPSNPRINEEVDFNATKSTGDITSYSWTFGDDNSDSGVTVEHAYNTTGQYAVTLTVTDSDGFTDTFAQYVYVENVATTGTILAVAIFGGVLFAILCMIIYIFTRR